MQVRTKSICQAAVIIVLALICLVFPYLIHQSSKRFHEMAGQKPEYLIIVERDVKINGPDGIYEISLDDDLINEFEKTGDTDTISIPSYIICIPAGTQGKPDELTGFVVRARRQGDTAWEEQTVNGKDMAVFTFPE